MSHRGYTARIEFDERDNIFVGRVLGLHTMIGFHGETVAELRSEFETAISEFLRDCKEQGVRPEKPASTPPAQPVCFDTLELLNDDCATKRR
ncbi:MAG: type II toxin-antitoxin system HicB family antitoxin [Acidobacteriota bacterium]